MAAKQKIIELSNDTIYIGFINRFQGIGIELECDGPIAERNINFTFQILFLWFKFWWIKYGKEEKI